MSSTHSRLPDLSSMSSSLAPLSSVLVANESSSILKDVSFEWMAPPVQQVTTTTVDASPIKDNSMNRELFQEPSSILMEGESVAIEEPSKLSFSCFPPLHPSQSLPSHSQRAYSQRSSKPHNRAIDWSVVNSARFPSIHSSSTVTTSASAGTAKPLPLSQAMGHFSQVVNTHRLPTQGMKRGDNRDASASKVWRAALDESAKTMPDVTLNSQGEMTSLLKKCILERESICHSIRDDLSDYDLATVITCDQQDTINRFVLLFHQGAMEHKTGILLMSCFVIQTLSLREGSVVLLRFLYEA